MSAAQNAERWLTRTSASPSQLKSARRHAECGASSSTASPVDNGTDETSCCGVTAPDVTGGELRSLTGAASATLWIKALAEGPASDIAAARGVPLRCGRFSAKCQGRRTAGYGRVATAAGRRRAHWPQAGPTRSASWHGPAADSGSARVAGTATRAEKRGDPPTQAARSASARAQQRARARGRWLRRRAGLRRAGTTCRTLRLRRPSTRSVPSATTCWRNRRAASVATGAARRSRDRRAACAASMCWGPRR